MAEDRTGVSPLVSRRQLVAAAAAAGMAGGCTSLGGASRVVAPSVSRSLHDLAQLSGRSFGSAVGAYPPPSAGSSFWNPAYREILIRECGVLTPENELKWVPVRSERGRYAFVGADRIIQFAQQHKLAVRGHTLLWLPEKWYPKWLVEHDFGSQSRAAAAAMLTDHVRTVCRRYGTSIYSYDVVNEAIQPETGRIRDTVLTRAMGGEALLDHMFHTAKAEAPHAELVYNDYMSWERGTEDETHIAGVLRLLEGFRKRGTPVEALGIQSHIRLLKPLPVAAIVAESTGPWRRFLDAVVGMGYKLVITEFDVNDQKAPDDVAERDRMVADYAKAYLDLMLTYPQLRDVIAWGMVDTYSWLTDFDPRPDKSLKRGTPYDSQFRPKPLRDAIAAAFLQASRR